MKIYLAGPDVFLPDAVEIGRRKAEVCAYHGLTGPYPLDNSIDPTAAGASLTIPEAQIVVEVGGCTYDFACNYNPEAAFDDGSCEVVSCALQGDLNGDLAVTTSDLLIFLSVFGETL